MTRRATILRAFLAGLLTAGVLATGLPASADEYDDQMAQTEAQQTAVDQALADLEDALEDTDAELVTAYVELQGIEAQIPVVAAQLATAEELVVRLQREAAILADRLEAALSEEAAIVAAVQVDADKATTTRVAIGQMARDAYKGDLAASSLSAVLDAESTDEFVSQSALASTALRTQTQALRDLDQLIGVNRNREVRLGAVREQITGLKAEADAQVVVAEAARADAAARKVALDALVEQARVKAAEVEDRKADQLAMVADLEAQRASLEADLAEIVRLQEERRLAEIEAARLAAIEAARIAGLTPPPTTTPPPPAGSTDDRPFRNPTSVSPMVVTSDYGQRFHPVLLYTRLHAGTDLRTWCGTPVFAAASGSVEWARPRPGFGNQVLVNHGYWNGSALMSSYNHLDSFTVSSGTTVSQGDLIGYSGNTGTSAACHLHFEVYLDGATIDGRGMIDA